VVHQRADELEGKAARADDHRAAEFDRLDPGRGEDPSHLLATRQVRRKLAAAESAEIDDPPDPGPSGSLGERLGSEPLHLLEVAGVSHRVDQIEGGVYALQRTGQGVRRQHVAADDLRLFADAALQPSRIPRHAAQPVPRRLERSDQPATDVAGGAGEQHAPI